MLVRTVLPSVCCALMLVAMGGCGIAVSGEPVGGDSVVRTVLPFVPTIAERSNDRNDGTSFEPCVAYSDAEIRSIGADPAKISDAAISDSPNYRGCHWLSTDEVGRFSQIVGNEKSTDAYKSAQSFRPWQPDRVIGGRTVIVTTEGDEGCFASFMSQNAIVHSAYLVLEDPSPGLQRECDIAIKWATMAIAKAP